MGGVCRGSMVTCTGSAGRITTPVWLEPRGIGSMPGTTAGRGAWISSALRLGKSMSGSRDLLMSMYHISGHPAVFATLMAVIDLTSFPRTLTDGFGVPTKPDSLQQTPEQLSTIGQELEDLTHPELSQTIESKSSREESQNHVLPFSIISTETELSGTMLLVIMRSQLSAKMWRVTQLSPDKHSQTSGFLEHTHKSLFIYLFIICCVIKLATEDWGTTRKLPILMLVFILFVSCRCRNH